MDSKHIKFLSLLETKVKHQTTSTFRVKIGAMLVHKNKPFIFGKNYIRTDPFQAKFSANEFCIHLHAEVNTIKRALKKISIRQLEQCTMYVLRIKYNSETKQTEWGMAKPCTGCQMCLAEFGIKKVVYTTEGSAIAFL